jgi:hypothetical protein
MKGTKMIETLKRRKAFIALSIIVLTQILYLILVSYHVIDKQYMFPFNMLSNELFVVLGVLTLFIMDTLEGKAK